MPNPIYFPFGSLSPASGQQVFPYDVIINEAYPGIVLDPTEPNAIYSALREVSGCVWWVLNADFNQNTNQWEQDSPTNASIAAYALEQCSDGTITRYVAVATVIPGNPVNWIPVWRIDANGFETISPLSATQAAQISQHIEVTWSAGTSTQMSATRLDVTDTSSNATSFIQDERVNNNPVWQVQKDGTLVTGIIPFARITGYTPPSFNNVTLTGTTTMTGDLHVEGNEQLDGNLTVNGSITGNSTLYIASHSDLHGGASVESGLTVTGGETVDNLTVTGTATLPSSAYPHITSPLVSINVGGTPQNPTVDVATPVPATIVGSITMPAVGSTVDITINSAFGFPQFSYIVVATNNGTAQFLGQVTTTVTSGGGTITQRVQNLQPQIGGPGTVFASGHGIIFSGSWTPTLGTVRNTYAAAVRPPGSPPTTATLTLPTLQGTSSQTYLLYAEMTYDTAGGGSQTLTGGGGGTVSWESPQTEPDFGGPQSIQLIGTANGGDTPSCTWTQTGGIGATNYVGIFFLEAIPSN